MNNDFERGIEMRGTNDLQSEMEQDSRLQRCGFAKLVGQDFEYFIRKYEISLGRKSKSTELDVVLGKPLPYFLTPHQHLQATTPMSQDNMQSFDTTSPKVRTFRSGALVQSGWI